MAGEATSREPVMEFCPSVCPFNTTEHLTGPVASSVKAYGEDATGPYAEVQWLDEQGNTMSAKFPVRPTDTVAGVSEQDATALQQELDEALNECTSPVPVVESGNGILRLAPRTVEHCGMACMKNGTVRSFYHQRNSEQ